MAVWVVVVAVTRSLSESRAIAEPVGLRGGEGGGRVKERREGETGKRGERGRGREGSGGWEKGGGEGEKNKEGIYRREEGKN